MTENNKTTRENTGRSWESVRIKLIENGMENQTQKETLLNESTSMVVKLRGNQYREHIV